MKLLLFFFIIITATLTAQTSGTSYVSSIEQKAREILKLQESIKKNENKILKLERDKKAAENEALKKYDDALEYIKNDKSWQNRLKTAQEGWEEYSAGTCSAGGPPPICVVNHWFKTSLAEAMKKYNTYKEAFLKPKRELAKNAGENFSKEIEKLNQENNRNKNRIDQLKEEIIALSRKFETAIHSEATDKASSSIKEMIYPLANLHYNMDMIEKYDQLILTHNKNEADQKERAKEKVGKQIEGLRKKIKTDIENIEHFYKNEENNLKTQQIDSDKEIAENRKELALVNEQLRTFEGTETAKNSLEEIFKNLQSSYYDLQYKQKELEQLIKLIPSKQNKDTALLQQELFKLTSNTFNLLSETEKIVTDSFQSKRNMLLESKEEKILAVKTQKSNFDRKVSDKEYNFRNYASKVDSERIRVLEACKSVSCNCYGAGIYNTISGIWNKEKDCLATLENARNKSTVIYGCEEITAYYKSLNSDIKGNLSDVESNKVNKTKLENRIQNIIQNKSK